MNAKAMVLGWSKDLPTWVQDGLRRGCQTGHITQEDEAALLLMAKADQGVLDSGSAPPEPIPLGKDHLSTALSTIDTDLVTGLQDVRHVNALAPNQALPIASGGLTVVFGFNGSGKSGYSRIFE